MSYQLDLEQIRINFKFHETTLKHNPNKQTKFLPYTTKSDKNKLKDFSMILGEFFRLVERKRTEKTIVFDDILEKMLLEISFDKEDDRDSFINIVNTIFQTDDNKTYMFHPYIYLYLSSDTETRKLGQFLFDVLLCEMDQRNGGLKINFGTTDVLSQLFIKVLPQLTEYHENEKPIYHCAVPAISSLFHSDLKWLLKNPNLFILHAEKLLKYYYFFYVSQFSLSCQRFLNDEEQGVQPIYFNLEWENTSSNRISYENGWKKIETPISQLFSHVNCLEFLNHKAHSNKVYFYHDIGAKLKSLDTEGRTKLFNDLEILLKEYQEKLSDTDWEGFKYKDIYDDPVKCMMYKLFRAIDYQFNDVSSRKQQYKLYQQWFVSFCQDNFIKIRGRLGKTLKLTPEYLLFITKVIIKDESKIRMKKLFEGFKERGIDFDRDSQNQIIKYFEAINIIEKKSDSGDAIYVKSFL
ncbi:DNA phosphorothioation-dependent restriction protein DptG [Paenibacillus sp. LHD-117]|uniref:DNA phosphorothioation-dependent restriction protein DptG n=1 Tax=Paenibacillus sp. LHD-117 TaxID=3071412 RepID=UPI0027E10C1B|nr:DNA phosphorothioation-dependent restriction protein DptG [Paenibacillus sp. LHD-117]MDQ6423053.1 DNA phosphorothioation-dependent restriction protein DptG [Paenibacillus sp. LHD-117]